MIVATRFSFQKRQSASADELQSSLNSTAAVHDVV